MEVIIDGIVYVPKENKLELDILEEKYKSGSYICVFQYLSSEKNCWAEHQTPKFTDYIKKYKLIHKKHKSILDAYLTDNSVEIECKSDNETYWTDNNFIKDYRENLEYRLKQKPYNDWRLPTIQELLTLVNYNKYNPACVLKDTQCTFYWSSSSYVVPNSSYAWVVSFGYGDNNWNFKSNSNLVRCVRDGVDGLEWSASSEKSMTWNEAMEYAKNLIAPVYYKG